MKKFSILRSSLLLALLFAACAKPMEEPILGPEEINDGSVRFTPKADYSYMWHQGQFPQDDVTKTEYSGDYDATLATGTRVYERINWVSGDVVTISLTTRTAGASSFGTSATSVVDYDIITPGTVSSGNKVHLVTVNPSSGQEKLKWQDGDYDYLFQGIYPAYTSSWVSTLKTEADKFKTNSWLVNNAGSGDGTRNTWKTHVEQTRSSNGKVAFVIPHTQNGSSSQTTGSDSQGSFTRVAADMRFAAMAAVTQVPKANVGSGAVSLAFRPLFNAYEFHIAPVNDEASLKNKKLLQARLYVDDDHSASLTGMWVENVTVPQSGSPREAIKDPSLSGATCYAHANGLMDTSNQEDLCSKEAVLTLNNVPFNQQIRLTFLSVPVEVSGLWLELRFEGNITRKFPLRTQDGNFITVSPGHKLLVSNLDVPGWEYVLTAPEEVYLEAGAGRGRLTGHELYPYIQSYKKSLVDQNITAPVEIQNVEFLDKDGNVCSTDPSWLNGFYTKESNPETSGSAAYIPIQDQWFGNGKKIDNAAHPIVFNYPSGQNTYTFYLDWAAVNPEYGIMDETPITSIPNYNSELGTSANPYNLYANPTPGTGLGAKESANCYVVNQPGWYMFPMVYGNAYKDDLVNTTSYNPSSAGLSGQGGDAPFLGNFINMDHKPISDIWIRTDVQSAKGNAQEWKPLILWQDAFPDYYIVNENDVQIIDYGGAKWVKFRIKPYDSETSTGFRPGNVVIAVAAKYGGQYTIAWSWHIWITGESLSTVNVAQHANKNGQVNQLMNMNLGWTPFFSYGTKPVFDYIRITQRDSKKTAATKLIRVKDNQHFESNLTSKMEGYSNTFYQWGRKDPFLPQSGRVASGNVHWDASQQKMVSTVGPGSRVVMNSRKNYYTGTPDGHQWPVFQVEGGVYSIRLPKGPMEPQLSTSGNPVAMTEANYNSWLGEMIKYPTQIFYDNCGKSLIYYYPEYVNLWNARQNDYSTSTSVVKTIYDPCPPGFCVPHYDAFSNFTSDGLPVEYTANSSGYSQVSSNEYTGSEQAYPGQDQTGGRTFPGGLYLPASGKRAYVDGSPQNHSKVGYYWSSSPNSNVNSAPRKSVTAKRFMFVMPGQVNWLDEINVGYDNRTRVVSIRPMVIPAMNANDQDYYTDGQKIVDGGGGVWE